MARIFGSLDSLTTQSGDYLRVVIFLNNKQTIKRMDFYFPAFSVVVRLIAPQYHPLPLFPLSLWLLPLIQKNLAGGKCDQAGIIPRYLDNAEEASLSFSVIFIDPLEDPLWLRGTAQFLVEVLAHKDVFKYKFLTISQV